MIKAKTTRITRIQTRGWLPTPSRGGYLHFTRPALTLLNATLLGLIVSFSGCMVGPNFSQPNSPILKNDFVAEQLLSPYSTVELSHWWQTFNDPILNGLLQQSQAQNLSLREAYERIVEARANLRLQGGQTAPNVNQISEYSYRKNSQNARPFVGQNGNAFDLFNLGLDTTWELDLFGKLARNTEAADAELKFQECDYASIRQTLFADIASSYLRIRLLQSQQNVIGENLAVQSETTKLVSERMEAGVSTELDKNQTDSFRYRTRTLQASIQQQLEVEFNQLGLLMGQVPDMALRERIGILPIPAIPVIPDVGMPADLLRRRPDVGREEMAVKAASARIGVAEADLYPQLSLLGSISVSSKNVAGLFETNGLDFAVGPSLVWNILHFGRIHANIEIQQARFQQALASYQNTVLKAVREVEDAMVNHQGYLEQWQALSLAIDADKKAVALSLERYQAGKANFQRVLDAQQQLLQDQQQAYQAQSLAITQLVRLYKAAGGCWNTDVRVAVNRCEPNHCESSQCESVQHESIQHESNHYQLYPTRSMRQHEVSLGY